MADPRFFKRAGPVSLAELASLTGAALSEGADAGRRFVDVAALDQAGPQDVSFLDNRKYVEAFRKTGAGACFVNAELARHAPANTACLVTAHPYKAYALAAQAFYPGPEMGTECIHPSAVIDPTAALGQNCQIGAGVVIGRNVKIGARCRILPNAVIDDNVEIGEDTEIGAGATLTTCLVGARVRIYPGVRIGQDGFGFAIDPAGHVTVPQLGRVIIEDNVEIGANTTIDRGAGPDTFIGRGSRIDNLVQIGHNVRIGKGCIIVAQVGISGSTELGDFVAAGGQAGFSGHIKIGAGARIGAQSGVMRDIPSGVEVVGSPAVPIREFMRRFALVGKMTKKTDTGGQEK